MADIPKPKSNFDATKDAKACPLCHVRTQAFWAAGLHRFIQAIDCTQATREALWMIATGGSRALSELLRLSVKNKECTDCLAADKQRGQWHQHVRIKVLLKADHSDVIWPEDGE